MLPYISVVLVEDPEGLPRRDTSQALHAFRGGMVTPASQGSIPGPRGGVGTQPRGEAFFASPPVSNAPPAIVAQLAGLLPSQTVVYAGLTLLAPQVGLVPPPGPGLGAPFNLNQFEQQLSSTSNSSGTGIAIAGQFASTSALYGALTGAGALSSLLPSSSLLSAPLTSVAQGSLTGIFAANSLLYGSLTATGTLNGLFVSNSLLQAQQIGGAFIPLIPMTAVTDVRLNVGYQPWKLHPDDVIG